MNLQFDVRVENACTSMNIVSVQCCSLFVDYMNCIIFLYILYIWNTSVSKVTGYVLDYRISILGTVRDFSFPHCVQTVSGAYQAAYPVGTWGCFP